MRLPTLALLLLNCVASAADFRAFLDAHCFKCHDADVRKGDLDLSAFNDESAVMRNREVWRSVYEKIESGQMPPPKEKEQPTPAQRQELLAWIMDIAARPDVALGAVDPGKPPLRRLTRLEYNNAIRDLLGLEMDVFMFPERLPLGDKSYFQPTSGSMSDTVKVSVREYGAKYPVLCRQLGMPGDNRAEHGYRNRGDAMDFSPLLLEKYLAAATDIVNAPELVEHSEPAARLFGAAPVKRTPSSASPKGALRFLSTGTLARDAKQWNKAEGIADNAPQRFFEDMQEAFAGGVGGVFDAGDEARGTATVPGKGGVLRVSYAGGAKALTINPNADLWLAGFATVKATSGSHIFTNQTKREKTFELTFGIENADSDEVITRLGVFVLGRKNQSGKVTLTAKFTDDTDSRVSAPIAEGAAGNTFFSFAAVPGEGVKSLLVDGSQFSGDYVVLDDLGFITSGRATKKVASARPPTVKTEAAAQTRAPASQRLATFLERAFRRPVSADAARRNAVKQSW